MQLFRPGMGVLGSSILLTSARLLAVTMCCTLFFGTNEWLESVHRIRKASIRCWGDSVWKVCHVQRHSKSMKISVVLSLRINFLRFISQVSPLVLLESVLKPVFGHLILPVCRAFMAELTKDSDVQGKVPWSPCLYCISQEDSLASLLAFLASSAT